MVHNILFVASFPIHPEKGGVQRVSYTLANEFKNKGINCWFLSLRLPDPGKIYDERQLFLLTTESSGKKFHKALISIIKQYNIDLVINQAGIYWSVIKRIRIVKQSEAILATVHHNCVSCLKKNHKDIIRGNFKSNKILKYLDNQFIWFFLGRYHVIKYRQYFRNAIKYSDVLVLLSESFKKELEEYGIAHHPEKIISILNPAPFKADPQSLDEKENRILYVGRVRITQKRIDRLLSIWEQLHNKYPQWHFDLVGNGDDMDYVKKFCLEKKLNRVHIHGEQDPIPFLKKAKIFTLSSDFEGFGMVLAEAQAFGTVPISYKCFSSINEIISNGHSGIVVDNFTVESYITQIEKLMQDEKLLHKMSQMALKQIKKFQAEQIVEKWIYEVDKLKIYR